LKRTTEKCTGSVIRRKVSQLNYQYILLMLFERIMLTAREIGSACE